MTARHLLIHGVVQGVGFRWSLAVQAEKHGLRGWVRNRDDGAVEAHLEGAQDDVEAVVEWAHDGPRFAHVTHVEVQPVADEGTATFELEYG